MSLSPDEQFLKDFRIVPLTFVATQSATVPVNENERLAGALDAARFDRNALFLILVFIVLIEVLR